MMHLKGPYLQISAEDGECSIGRAHLEDHAAIVIVDNHGQVRVVTVPLSEMRDALRILEALL